MNYRHIFHAGNFADVFKHILLVAVLDYLRQKDKPFCVIDTHAGAGLYDLSDDKAQRTQESALGIEKLLSLKEEFPQDVVGHYVQIVRQCRVEHGGKPVYPGSPWLVRALLRRDDRLMACELHPETFSALKKKLDDGRKIRCFPLDGYEALQSFVPPKERRGLVLIDPPFEKKDEFRTLAEALARAWKKWPGGVYALWFPIKRLADCEEFYQALEQAGIADMTVAELLIQEPVDDTRLNGCGMVLVNAPWVFAKTLPPVLDFLTRQLAKGEGAYGRYRGLGGGQA